jgi:CheY-like chemotaxis protein
VHSSGQHLLGILNDILDFSKIEARKLDLEYVDFDVRANLRDTVEMLSFKAQEKGLDLACHVDPRIPGIVCGDAGRLRQILVNLIGNAIKFTERGSVTIHAVRTQQDAGTCTLRFEIADTGIGIPPGKVGSLFSPFVQADGSTTRRHGGTGLGLAISKELVTKMGGEITVETEPGRGSTFGFTAIFAQPEGKEQPVDVPLRAQLQTLQLGRLAEILVAEDNPTNQEVSLAMLDQLGFHATGVANGEEALERLREADYDLVLMDCEMPGMDGYETTRRIRAGDCGRNREVPIVALTADAMPEVRGDCLAAGMNDYLAKPVWPAELAATLTKWLSLTAIPAAPQELAGIAASPAQHVNIGPGGHHGSDFSGSSLTG